MGFSKGDSTVMVVGVVSCLLLGAFSGWLVKFGIDQRKDNAFRRKVCTEGVTGVVSDYRLSGTDHVSADGTSSGRYFPVFKYSAEGKIYTTQSERYDTNGKRRYRIGQTLAVFHAPDDPEKVYIPKEGEGSEENAWLCIGFGGALLAFCAFAVVRLILMSREGF